MPKKDKLPVRYKIEDGNIILSKVSNLISCEVCGQNLAVNNKGAILIKTFATLLDVQKNELTLKCGKCKSFNTIKIHHANRKNAKCLLVV